MAKPVKRDARIIRARELDEKISHVKDGLIACHETIQIGQAKLARLEADRNALRAPDPEKER